MAAEPLLFDPELEGLLRELAADPRSQLLRLPRPRTLPQLLARPDLVRPTHTGLTKAERHLLHVHRDELANVLRRACLMRFFSDPERAIYLNRSIDAHTQIQVETPEQWRARARDTLADLRRSPDPLEGIALVEACLRPDTERSVTITQLARASMLLQPTDTADSYVGLDLLLSDRFAEGASVMEGVLARPSTRVIRSCALEALGHASSQSGDTASACMLYRAASDECLERPSASVGWLASALQAGLKAQAIEAGARLDQTFPSSEPAIRDLIEGYAAQVSAGNARVSHECDLLTRELEDRFGSLSREVSHVLVK